MADESEAKVPPWVRLVMVGGFLVLMVPMLLAQFALLEGVAKDASPEGREAARQAALEYLWPLSDPALQPFLTPLAFLCVLLIIIVARRGAAPTGEDEDGEAKAEERGR